MVLWVIFDADTASWAASQRTFWVSSLFLYDDGWVVTTAIAACSY